MAVSLVSTGVTFPDNSTQTTAATGFGFKNRIINGAMVIDQRNAGASVATSSGVFVFTLDRWQAVYSQVNKFTVQQNAGSLSAANRPAGFTNYLGITSSSAYTVGASELFNLVHGIEGFNIADLNWGTASASPITISFWVRSSLTGTFGATLNNLAINRFYGFTYTISAANTWEYKTVTVAGDTSGTWATDNTGGVYIRFGLGVGASVSGAAGSWGGTTMWGVTGATSVVGTNGATFYITGVQLEKGSTATSFDYRPYGTELALCQRYYFQYVKGTDQSVGIGTYYSATAMYTVIQTPVTMRAKPTLSSASGTNYYSFFRNSAGDNFDSLSLDGYEHINGAMLKNTTEMSGTAGQAGFVTTNNASAALALSSEL